MTNLIIAILASVSVSIFLKVARGLKIDISQAIAMNYLSALGLTYYLLKPDFNKQPIGEVFAQNQYSVLFLSLGILLPIVFIFFSRAVTVAGIVRSDAAQRLSLFLSILAAFTIFGEKLTAYKGISLIVALIALVCLLWKKSPATQTSSKTATNNSWLPLLLVWIGYGVIDILFKEMSKLGGQFTITLFVSFCLAACVMFIYLLVKRVHWTGRSMLAGLFLGCLNFVNIYFYIKAHQSFSGDPTTVFAGMNIGVICLGTLVGAGLFKEKVSKINATGILLGVLSIISLFYLNRLL